MTEKDGKDEVERTWRAHLYEELVAERWDRTLPYKMRTWIHMSKPPFNAAIPTVQELERDINEWGRERRDRRE